MNIEILDEAIQDLKYGYEFYEEQEEGLGSYFLDSILADIESLQISSGTHPRHYGFYRLLANRFPFAIYYLLEDESVQIYAVLDCRRRPTWIRKRLEEN